MSYVCEECGFDLYNPIEDDGILVASKLGLYNDGRYPGRCILALSSHYTEFTMIDPDLLREFMLDVQMVGLAIEKATGATRINYAILGNAEPHVHCHIIPRLIDNEPNPYTTPWSRKDGVWEMPEKKCQKIIEKIQYHLHRIGE